MKKRLSRHLMVSGLGFWGLGVSGAYAPRVVGSILFPNRSGEAPFRLVAARPLEAPIVWTLLVVWCVSWALVVGYLTTALAERRRRPSWTNPALLLLSLASPFAFAFALSALVPLATRGAIHADGAVSFLPAVILQLVISQIYVFMTGSATLRPSPA